MSRAYAKPIIRTSGLSKSYGDVQAVKKLNLEIFPGEVFGLLGPNGAGKTTTTLMLLGLTDPTSGHAAIDGKDCTRNSLAVKNEVGYLPDKVGFYPAVTGRDNLIYSGMMNGLSREAAAQRADELMERVGIAYAGNRKAGTYSRGMRQRLGIADVLMKKPKIIIMDEPTSGIDPQGTRELTKLIRELADRDGLTILISSHDLYQIQAISDRVGIFVKGKMIACGKIDELGAQLTRNYHVVLADYEKTLRYKNRLLKDEASRDLIAAIDETLVTCGSQLFCYRVALFTRMMPQLQRIYADISNEGEAFAATYLPSWDHVAGIQPSLGGTAECLAGTPIEMRENGAPDRDQVRELLADSLARFAEEEARRHRSLLGPHNDKIAFYLAGRDASAFASQGQQRSIVLAWKLAEVELVRQTLGANPVLLLDDVMSELDETRRDTLVNFASDDIQTFITATDLTTFNPTLLERARIIQL